MRDFEIDEIMKNLSAGGAEAVVGPFSEAELKHAASIIALTAANNGVPESQVREEMREAIAEAMQSAYGNAQKIWKTFRYSGEEPTPEEFVLWIAHIIDASKKAL